MTELVEVKGRIKSLLVSQKALKDSEDVFNDTNLATNALIVLQEELGEIQTDLAALELTEEKDIMEQAKYEKITNDANIILENLSKEITSRDNFKVEDTKVKGRGNTLDLKEYTQRLKSEDLNKDIKIEPKEKSEEIKEEPEKDIEIKDEDEWTQEVEELTALDGKIKVWESKVKLLEDRTKNPDQSWTEFANIIREIYIEGLDLGKENLKELEKESWDFSLTDYNTQMDRVKSEHENVLAIINVENKKRKENALPKGAEKVKCSDCGEIVVVKDPKRPINIECEICGRKGVLKGKRTKLQCPNCEEIMEVHDSKRPINIDCKGCGKKLVLTGGHDSYEKELSEILKPPEKSEEERKRELERKKKEAFKIIKMGAIHKMSKVQEAADFLLRNSWDEEIYAETGKSPLEVRLWFYGIPRKYGIFTSSKTIAKQVKEFREKEDAEWRATMVLCPNCGERQEDEDVCTKCGKEIYDCPTCGAYVTPESTKCPECGEEFENDNEENDSEEISVEVSINDNEVSSEDDDSEDDDKYPELNVSEYDGEVDLEDSLSADLDIDLDADFLDVEEDEVSNGLDIDLDYDGGLDDDDDPDPLFNLADDDDPLVDDDLDKLYAGKNHLDLREHNDIDPLADDDLDVIGEPEDLEENSIYKCGVCGAVAGESDEKCLTCGTKFDEKEGELE